MATESNKKQTSETLKLKNKMAAKKSRKLAKKQKHIGAMVLHGLGLIGPNDKVPVEHDNARFLQMMTEIGVLPEVQRIVAGYQRKQQQPSELSAAVACDHQPQQRQPESPASSEAGQKHGFFPPVAESPGTEEALVSVRQTLGSDLFGFCAEAVKSGLT